MPSVSSLSWGRVSLILRLVFLAAGAAGSAGLVRFRDERDGGVMFSGVSMSEGSWGSAAGARRARVLALRADGGMLAVLMWRVVGGEGGGEQAKRRNRG